MIFFFHSLFLIILDNKLTKVIKPMNCSASIYQIIYKQLNKNLTKANSTTKIFYYHL